MGKLDGKVIVVTGASSGIGGVLLFLFPPPPPARPPFPTPTLYHRSLRFLCMHVARICPQDLASVSVPGSGEPEPAAGAFVRFFRASGTMQCSHSCYF